MVDTSASGNPNVTEPPPTQPPVITLSPEKSPEPTTPLPRPPTPDADLTAFRKTFATPVKAVFQVPAEIKAGCSPTKKHATAEILGRTGGVCPKCYRHRIRVIADSEPEQALNCAFRRDLRRIYGDAYRAARPPRKFCKDCLFQDVDPNCSKCQQLLGKTFGIPKVRSKEPESQQRKESIDGRGKFKDGKGKRARRPEDKKPRKTKSRKETQGAKENKESSLVK